MVWPITEIQREQHPKHWKNKTTGPKLKMPPARMVLPHLWCKQELDFRACFCGSRSVLTNFIWPTKKSFPISHLPPPTNQANSMTRVAKSQIRPDPDPDQHPHTLLASYTLLCSISVSYKRTQTTTHSLPKLLQDFQTPSYFPSLLLNSQINSTNLFSQCLEAWSL